MPAVEPGDPQVDSGSPLPVELESHNAPLEWLVKVRVTTEFVMLVSGIDADVWVRQAYEQKGLRGVPALVDRVASEVSKSTYYAEFFALDSPPDAERRATLSAVSP